MTATIGDNKGPTLDAFDVMQIEILDLFELAESALTGEPIANQDQADQIDQIAKDCLKASQNADAARKEEKRPHDEAAKAVQAKWTPLIGKADLARSTALKALTPWKLEIQRQKDEAAAKVRAEAEAIAQKAREAAMAANAANDLAAREQAEALLVEADKAKKEANKVDRSATGLRTTWRAEIVDRRLAFNHYIKQAPDQFVELLQRLASQDVRAGIRNIPGVEAIEERKAA